MIHTNDPTKKLKLEDKVEACKSNLTKLTMIHKAKHYNNYFLQNKINLLKTWDEIREIINNVDKKTSTEINYLQVSNKPVIDMKDIERKFNIHFTAIAQKIEKI